MVKRKTSRRKSRSSSRRSYSRKSSKSSRSLRSYSRKSKRSSRSSRSSRSKSSKNSMSSKMRSKHFSCSKDGVKVPAKVKAEAKKGLAMIKNGYAGGTSAGIKRAKQLASCSKISIESLKEMQRFYSRHMYTSLPGYNKWKKDKSPVELIKGKTRDYRGAVAILIWGGISAFYWLRGKDVQRKLEDRYPGQKNSLESYSHYNK